MDRVAFHGDTTVRVRREFVNGDHSHFDDETMKGSAFEAAPQRIIVNVSTNVSTDVPITAEER